MGGMCANVRRAYIVLRTVVEMVKGYWCWRCVQWRVLYIAVCVPTGHVHIHILGEKSSSSFVIYMAQIEIQMNSTSDHQAPSSVPPHCLFTTTVHPLASWHMFTLSCFTM